MARPKRQTEQEARAQLLMLEVQARGLFHSIMSFGVASDPVIFSTLISQFAYTAGRLRKQRIKLGVK